MGKKSSESLKASSNKAAVKRRLQIPFDEEYWEKIDQYARAFNHDNRTAAGRECIKLVLKQCADLKQTSLFKTVLERKFSLPTHITVRGLLSELTRVASAYPRQSAKDYWGADIYLSSIDKTHAEVFRDVTDEIRILADKLQEIENVSDE